MRNYRILTLIKGKEKALGRKHPWVFSGAFKALPSDAEEGEIVQVNTAGGSCCGMGFYRPGSIRVMLFSFEAVEDISTFLQEKLKKALAYRRTIGFFDNAETNSFRLAFGEGDGLPGLIIDKYAETAVIQMHQRGWLPLQDMLAETLVANADVKQVYSKPTEKTGILPRYIIDANIRKSEVLENGNRFIIDWEGGQKTGFFLDQRNNRKRLGDLVKGKTVLNTYAYTGGFSVYALAGEAKKVVSVDLSEPAIALANKNAEINGYGAKHTGVASDVLEYLKAEEELFDLIILDPPAFSKSRRTVHNAVQAYKRLNLAALKKVKPGGLIFTFSCSQHVSPQLFMDTLRAAGIESGKSVRVMEKLVQPADHPINLFFPEGEYLKGAILEVN